MAAFTIDYFAVDADMVALYYVVGIAMGAVAGLLYSVMTREPGRRPQTWTTALGFSVVAGLGAWFVVVVGWLAVRDFREAVSVSLVVVLNAYSLPLTLCAGGLSFGLGRLRGKRVP